MLCSRRRPRHMRNKHRTMSGRFCATDPALPRWIKDRAYTTRSSTGTARTRNVTPDEMIHKYFWNNWSRRKRQGRNQQRVQFFYSCERAREDGRFVARPKLCCCCGSASKMMMLGGFGPTAREFAGAFCDCYCVMNTLRRHANNRQRNNHRHHHK
jgi:hypothetical protein